jgi:hypothetical protein
MLCVHATRSTSSYLLRCASLPVTHDAPARMRKSQAIHRISSGTASRSVVDTAEVVLHLAEPEGLLQSL